MDKSVIGDSAETLGTGDNSLISASVSITLVILLTYIIFRYQKETRKQENLSEN